MSGSVAYVLAHRLSEAGEQVALIDADTTGAALFERVGESARRMFSPSERGLPSLIASRAPLTVALLADHSYSIDTSEGSLWVLFGPRHRRGGAYAAGWLAERFNDLAEIDAERRLVIAASLLSFDSALEKLLARVPAAAVVAPVGDLHQLSLLRDELGACGLFTWDGWRMGAADRQVCLVVEGESAVPHDEIAQVLGIPVIGSLPVSEDEKVLRTAAKRRLPAVWASLTESAQRMVAADATGQATGLGTAAPRPLDTVEE